MENYEKWTTLQNKEYLLTIFIRENKKGLKTMKDTYNNSDFGYTLEKKVSNNIYKSVESVWDIKGYDKIEGDIINLAIKNIQVNSIFYEDMY